MVPGRAGGVSEKSGDNGAAGDERESRGARRTNAAESRGVRSGRRTRLTARFAHRRRIQTETDPVRQRLRISGSQVVRRKKAGDYFAARFSETAGDRATGDRTRGGAGRVATLGPSAEQSGAARGSRDPVRAHDGKARETRERFLVPAAIGGSPWIEQGSSAGGVDDDAGGNVRRRRPARHDRARTDGEPGSSER